MSGIFSKPKIPMIIQAALPPQTPAAPPPVPVEAKAPSAPPPPPTMPDPMSPDAMQAKRRAQVEGSRGGRQSTILSTAASRAGGTLAGGAAGNKLGAT